MQPDTINNNKKQQIRVEIHHGQLRERKPEAPKKNQEEEDQELRTSMSLASGLGFSVLLPMIGGIFLGKVVDGYAHTDKTFTIIFLFLGCALGIANILVLLKKN